MLILKAVSFFSAIASGALLVGALSLIAAPKADADQVGTSICYDQVDLSDPKSITREELASFHKCMNLVQFGVHSYL